MSTKFFDSNTLVVYLERHGEYRASLLSMLWCDKMSKAQLVAGVLEIYCSFREPDLRTKKYWNQFPKAVLQVLYCSFYAADRETV